MQICYLFDFCHTYRGIRIHIVRSLYRIILVLAREIHTVLAEQLDTAENSEVMVVFIVKS